MAMHTEAKQHQQAKPFLKWAGSKRQLLDQFTRFYPQALPDGKIRHYYEVFLGSGAVFIDIIQRYEIENVYLSDVNPELVLTWRVVKEQVSALVTALQKHEKKYLALEPAGRLQYFYKQRTAFNLQRSIEQKDITSKSIARAAQLIFLNKTCFNGLFRVNSKGAFNTPAGRYSNPSICDADNLLAVSALLERAHIQQADYATALKSVRARSFVYLDPPYRPLSRTASFTAYSHGSFNDKDQAALAGRYRRLNREGALAMLSNSDTQDDFFDNLYKGFSIARVPARRLINANASRRGPVNEIIVCNYPVAAKP